MKKFAILSVKLIIAFLALYYVLSVTDLHKIWSYIKKSNPFFLVLAFAGMNLATTLSGLRLRGYLEHYGCKIKAKEAVKLFYVGTLFNLILPGGIGGDGYLALRIKKTYKMRFAYALKILIATRANGLLFLNMALFCLFWFSDFIHISKYIQEIILILFLLQFPVYFAFSKFFFKETIKSFLRVSFFSSASQIMVLLTVLFILLAMGVDHKFVDYLSLYSASAVASIIPLTPGGVGIRELVYFQGAALAGLNPEFAVACSLIYFTIYFFTGLIGLIFYLKQTHEKE